jgi:histidyl-tRNA synthetase
MQDLPQDVWLRRRHLQDGLVELMGSYGYRFLETPILESTELFLRKSGGELASRIYSFSDVGSNSVSLRPEFTAPIMRHYLEHAGAVQLPARWQYSGPVFRYEEDGDASRQFTQVGAELLGSASVLADAEIMDLAFRVPGHLGLAGCRLELGDLDVVHSVLDAVGVSDRARTFIVGNIPRLREGEGALYSALERASQLHLAGAGTEDSYLSAAIQGLDDVQARSALHGLLQWTAVDQLGQRSPSEVVDRLLRKLRGSDDLAKLRRGLELVADLVAIRGEPAAVLDTAGAVIHRAGADPAALARLEQVLGLLRHGGLGEPGAAGSVVLDLGLVRGLAYYNGIVFEVKHPSWPGSLGGGGRYDGLARALGSPDPIPALGFAYTLEPLLALAESTVESSHPHPFDQAQGRPNPPPSRGREFGPSVLVLAEDREACGRALGVARELRGKSVLVELDVCGRALAEGLFYARQKGLTEVTVVHRDGHLTTHSVE